MNLVRRRNLGLVNQTAVLPATNQRNGTKVRSTIPKEVEYLKSKAELRKRLNYKVGHCHQQ